MVRLVLSHPIFGMTSDTLHKESHHLAKFNEWNIVKEYYKKI